DNTPPTITTCASNQSAFANGLCQAPVPDFTSGVVATDCNGSAPLSITQTPVAGTLVGLGVTTVTLHVTDGATNESTCTATFSVVEGTIDASGPSDMTVTSGQSATFSVSASGTGPLSYQWKKDGVAIGGATGSSYSIPSVGTGDAGTYCVVVTGTCKSVTNCASLTVLEPTSAAGPNDMTLITGGTGTFSTTASGTGPFTYQWTKDGVDIGAATNTDLNLGPVSTNDAGIYCVVISGAANSVTNCASLTVLEPTSATGP